MITAPPVTCESEEKSKNRLHVEKTYTLLLKNETLRIKSSHKTHQSSSVKINLRLCLMPPSSVWHTRICAASQFKQLQSFERRRQPVVERCDNRRPSAAGMYMIDVQASLSLIFLLIHTSYRRGEHTYAHGIQRCECELRSGRGWARGVI